MTITYQFEVATSSFFGFAKLLGKWRGSIYKLVYKEMLMYMAAFALISASYRIVMNDDQREQFESLSLYCARYIDMIPLSFVLGFYVTFVVQRWWNQFQNIPWPDRLMNAITCYVEGGDERGRMIRRTLMRWWNLSFVMILSSISIAVKKRFPTWNHIVEAGFMTEEEQHILENTNIKVNKYWMPMTWFIRLLDQTKKEGRVRDSISVKHILEELNETRSRMSLLWCHDWVTVPLVYTQVATWAIHLYCLACLIGRQYLDTSKGYPGHDLDLYFPVFTFMQFFFYLGWLKVAEQLINPFGEDDDDFETNWLIDRHIQVSYMGVDELYNKLPPIVKDLYWDSHQPNLPYTAASMIHRIPTYSGSTMHLKIPDREQPLLHGRFSPDLDDEMEDEVVNYEEMSFIKKLKLCLNCGSEDDSNEKWTKMKSGVEDAGAKLFFYPRTLGRKESLMADDLLATLNSGRRRSGRMERNSSKPNGFLHDYSHGQDGHSDAFHLMEGGGGGHGHSHGHSHLHVPKKLHYARQDSVESTFSAYHGAHGGSSYKERPESPLHMKPLDQPSRFYISEADEDELPQTIDNKLHVLGRLSEVENENDGDASTTNTPVQSPYTTVMDIKEIKEITDNIQTLVEQKDCEICKEEAEYNAKTELNVT